MMVNTQELYQVTFKGYPDVLSVPQVCEILGVSTKTVYRLLRGGKILSLRIGREFRVPKLHLMSYMGFFDPPVCFPSITQKIC